MTSKTTTLPAWVITISETLYWIQTRQQARCKSALTYNNPHFSNDNNRGSNGDSYYNGVNVQFTTNDIHRSGLSVVANYTYAHNLDDLSSTFSDSGTGNVLGGLGYMNSFAPGP